MSDYMHAKHFWEYQHSNPSGVATWERYGPSVQKLLCDRVSKRTPAIAVEEIDCKIIFDHENGNHRHRNVKTGADCAVRMTPEVLVDDWCVFTAMADVSEITKLDLRGTWANTHGVPKDRDIQELAKIMNDCKSLRILQLGTDLTDTFGAALGNAVATHSTLIHLVIHNNNFGDETGVALGKALTTNTSLHTLDLGGNSLRDKGGASIIRGLRNNTTLRVLNLDRNGLSETFGVAMQDDLAHNTGLHALYLGFNNLRDTSGVAIAKALTANTTLKHLYLKGNYLGEESGAALVDALIQNSTLTKLDVRGNNAISFATQAKIKFALSPELKGLLNTPSVSPSRISVCVVGFGNVGKTELVNTWYRTTAHETPHLDPEETAEAKPDNIRNKTSGISIKPITLQLEVTRPCENAQTLTNHQRSERISNAVHITAWDFAGHTEYYLSHELLMRACRGAVFVLLFRINSLQPNVCRAEQQRVFFWLKFIASMYTNQVQPPTVFIGGTFRPDDDTFDVDATSEWTDSLLQKAKAVFGCVLNLPQHSIYHMDCRKSNDPHVTALRNLLAQTVEEIRTREDRKVPPICEYATNLLHDAKHNVTAELALYEENMKSRRLNPNIRVKPLSWQTTVCGPIMTRADFEEHVLGKLKVKANESEHGSRYNASITPKSKQLLHIITAYLHDVGDILWFDVDGVRDTVILTPDLFCSKIIGAIFRPGSPGFSIDAIHGDGGLVPKDNIATTFKLALGITNAHVDAALAILCQLGLCHRHQDPNNGKDSYLFPGALAATTFKLPEWFGPLPPGQHFVVGRRFTLVDPATTIFTPGCMSQIQVWVLGRYKGSMIWRNGPKIWRDGVIIPYTATQSLAEAGVRLHRPLSSSSDGTNHVYISSITLVVRGSDANAKEDCLRLLNTLCTRIRVTSGVDLKEETLPASELAQLASTKETNMLDVSCNGYLLSPNNNRNNPNTSVVVVNGKSYTMDSLRNGAFVPVPPDFCESGGVGEASVKAFKDEVATIKQHVTNQSVALKHHVTEQTTQQTTLVTTHITSETSRIREQLNRLETRLTQQLATAFESEAFKRVVKPMFAATASELGEIIRARVQSDIANLQTQLTSMATVSATHEVKSGQQREQLERSITNLCANIKTLETNTTTSIANVGSSVANVCDLVADVGASLHQLLLSKKTPWLFFIVKDSTHLLKHVYHVHLLCNGTKHSPPHFLFKSKDESDITYRRGFELTELKLLSKYALNAALSVVSLVVTTSVACVAPPLLNLITPALAELLSGVSDSAITAITTKVTNYTQTLMTDLQQMIPNAEDDAAQHIHERSVGFDMSLSTQVGDATVTTFALEGNTQQHHVKIQKGLGEDETITITVSGSKAVWVGVKRLRRDTAEVRLQQNVTEVVTIFDLGEHQHHFPNNPTNVDVVLTRKGDNLILSWGRTRSNFALALTPLGLDEEWVPVVATNDSKCRVYITPPSFPYMPLGESFEDFLTKKNKHRLNSKRSEDKGYKDWCGLSYYDNPPGGFGDGKGTPMWICQDCRDKEKIFKFEAKHDKASPTKDITKKKHFTSLCQIV